MIELIIQTFWFLLPAGIANMSPVIFKWVPLLNYPVDSNKKFRGKPMLGKNKTYRGLLVGTVMAILTVYIQGKLYPQMIDFSIIDYSQINIILLGFLLGFGALAGDMVESFFKRQVNIKPGKSWVPFDQIDWIVGSIIFASMYINVPLKFIITSIILFGVLHPLVNLTGYFLRIKKNKF
jgi:CDP-2,3-bis-(O-geranylgeranyl)-sn-glycerol synthase